MRRRRQSNRLLTRILVISIVAHLILLPVLAHFGAFKKIQQHFQEVQAVRLPPPPPPEKAKPEAKKEQKTPPKVAQKARRGSTTSHARQAAQKSNLNQPKVIASAGGPGGGDNGPTVDPNGTGKAGQLPTEQTSTKAPTVKPPDQPKPEPPKPEPPKPEPPKEIARADKPAPQPVQPKPEPMPAKKAPVFTEAEPAMPVDQQPKPSIPDDLRADALDKTCVVRFTVEADGSIGHVEIAQSSGSDELDRAALDAAKQWRFKPATRDGEPVESQVNLHIQFEVS